MLHYMDYIERCFYTSTNWNVDNLNENILATSDNVINFNLPSGFRFDISSNATAHNYSTFTFSNTGKLTGSLAYLYCSTPLKNVTGTQHVRLQNAVSGYRMIESSPINSESSVQKNSMLYGKMYLPTRALEAMYINRFSPTSQLVLKCINLPKQTKAMNLNTGIMTLCLQNDVGRYSREFLFSTNEALLGFRFLYNFGYNSDNRYAKLFDKNMDSLSKNLHVDSSMLSVGAELWYGALNMSPGFSSCLRYTTHSTSTGKPLTLTLACNPILGNISSSYSVKTSVSSTFSSKYDFNIYSYESNLSLGLELWRLSRHHLLKAQRERERYMKPEDFNHDYVQITKKNHNLLKKSPLDPPVLDDKIDYYGKEYSQNNDVIKTFSKLVNESDFASVIKLSTSLKDRNLKFLWEGRFKGFLMSGGFCLDFKSPTFETPVVGLEIQYAS